MIEKEQHYGVERDPDHHGREHTGDKHGEGDVATSRDDEVLRVPDRGRGRTDVGARRESYEERQWGQLLAMAKLEDEAREHEATSVVGEEGSRHRA